MESFREEEKGVLHTDDKPSWWHDITGKFGRLLGRKGGSQDEK